MAAPEPFDATALVAASEVDPALMLIVFAAGTLYVSGVRRLAHRGRGWRANRTACFAGGLATICVATQSGLAAYDTVLFSAHVAQHVLLGVVAPFLLVLGAPVTLALQASARPTQVKMLRVLHHPATRAAAHPLVGWLAFGSTLFGLYFTGVYEFTLRNQLAHIWMHLHFIVVGCLFFWAVIGLDPVPWRVPFGGRLLLVLFTIPIHAFLGLALFSLDVAVADDWYAGIGRTWGASALSDQRTGAGIMWATGDLVGLVAGAVVLAQWMRSEDRAGRRADAAADRRLADVVP